MTHTPSATDPSKTGASPASLAAQRLIAAALGVFIIGMVGFTHMSVAHNASHDYRHSMAFPCH
ncbi:CbtB domain-containing protein [Amaricoccus sp.]|uniref:CbtB domain-containing protein n=1 Tax=Amaricoccus sp. TaxID=1872485 RepID=UPI001B7A9A63|nr:CbtB domain-containing protein [Amaricoccus sp.]MBP7242368.1 CbtB-domain containing protein [Amaricoccus sp.]